MANRQENYTSGILVELRAEVERLQRELGEMQATFDLQQSRIMVAQKAWQQRHGKPNVWPDLGELIDWIWGECKIACEARQEAEDASEETERQHDLLKEAAEFYLHESLAIFMGELGADWADHFGPAYEAAMKLRAALGKSGRPTK